MNRKEHLEWCKKRAIEYVDRGDLVGAFASMSSDLNKHPETQNHMGIEMGMTMVVGGFLNTPDEMRKYINGFN